jgi:translation initiation factor 2B subunit (eIF-2B alpha/beta/delta family)
VTGEKHPTRAELLEDIEKQAQQIRTFNTTSVALQKRIRFLEEQDQIKTRIIEALLDLAEANRERLEGL